MNSRQLGFADNGRKTLLEAGTRQVFGLVPDGKSASSFSDAGMTPRPHGTKQTNTMNAGMTPRPKKSEKRDVSFAEDDEPNEVTNSIVLPPVAGSPQSSRHTTAISARAAIDEEISEALARHTTTEKITSVVQASKVALAVSKWKKIVHPSTDVGGMRRGAVKVKKSYWRREMINRFMGSKKKMHTPTMAMLTGGLDPEEGSYEDAYDAEGGAGGLLHYLAALGMRHHLEELINNGANIHELDSWGRNVVHHAAFHGHPLTIWTSHRLGAYINRADAYGMQPLHHAAATSRTALAALINLSADICEQDSRGRTALHIAASFHGRASECEILIQNKANPNVCTSGVETPLICAIKAGNELCVRALCRLKADVSLREKKSLDAPIHVAVLFQKVSCIEALLENDADIDAKNSFDLTPLHLAARSNMANIARVLLRLKADIYGAGGFLGQTPLHVAVTCSSKEVVETLLGSEASVGVVDKLGFTALHTSIQHKNVEILSRLMSTKWFEENPNPVSNAGDTLIHLAVRMKCEKKTFQDLIYAKSDVNYSTGEWTALHLAVVLNNQKIAHTLLENWADPNQDNGVQAPIHLAARCGFAEIIEYLYAYSADANALTSKLETPILLAVRKNHVDCVKNLILAGASLEKSEGLHPIQHAIICNSFEALKCLHQYGEDEIDWDEELKDQDQGDHKSPVNLCKIFKRSESFTRFVENAYGKKNTRSSIRRTSSKKIIE